MTARAAPARRAVRFDRSLPFAILLAAFALRSWQLTDVPPGLTHDEAGHGHDAAYILKGLRLIYFTVGYGREPLFEYFNAGLIAGLGASAFALRFSAVIWGTIALAATYRVASMAFDRRTGWLALALMAVSFWPLTTSRQILRSAMLPGEMAVAVILFLRLVDTENAGRKWLPVFGLGLVIAASLYTYIPARALWLMFPLALTTQYVVRRWPASHDRFTGNHGSVITSLSISLLLAFLVASPLFLYLYRHPEAEQRIGMLSEPLNALRHGDPSRIAGNAREAGLAFFLPGHGDHFLATSIPGRPFFDPVTFLLVLAGLVLLARQAVGGEWRSLTTHRPGQPLTAWLLIYWILLGLAPSVITGPEAMVSRIMGAQPALYILPALALARLSQGAERLRPAARRFGMWKLGVGLYLVVMAAFSVRDFFFVWGQSPDVRAAYRVNLVVSLHQLDAPAVISSDYPSAAHDPYLGELFTTQPTRWVDARLALIRPNTGGFQVLIPASTPPHRSFLTLLKAERTYELRPDDLNPYFTLYSFVGAIDLVPSPTSVKFNEAVILINNSWSAETYTPGDVAELSTTWQVADATRLGPIYPPAFKTDLNLFTHVLNPDGSIFLQQDRLDAPSWDWQNGDVVVQIHPFAIPPGSAPGEYAVEVGVYDRLTGERLLTDEGADRVMVAPLVIQE